ncbi:MAG TPA: hypothetical protein VKQ52_04665 [Puia sp.]|nr:hypothetical protein [Puia sp.]
MGTRLALRRSALSRASERVFTEAGALPGLNAGAFVGEVDLYGADSGFALN